MEANWSYFYCHCDKMDKANQGKLELISSENNNNT